MQANPAGSRSRHGSDRQNRPSAPYPLAPSPWPAQRCPSPGCSPSRLPWASSGLSSEHQSLPDRDAPASLEPAPPPFAPSAESPSESQKCAASSDPASPARPPPASAAPALSSLLLSWVPAVVAGAGRESPSTGSL